MTKAEFDKKKWGAGMRILYEDDSNFSITNIEADVVSVDFEKRMIGIEIPGINVESVDDLVWLPHDKCKIIKDFQPKT